MQNLKRGRVGGHTKQVQKHEKALEVIKHQIENDKKKRGSVL
jgi:hypothetical protein